MHLHKPKKPGEDTPRTSCLPALCTFNFVGAVREFVIVGKVCSFTGCCPEMLELDRLSKANGPRFEHSLQGLCNIAGA